MGKSNLILITAIYLMLICVTSVHANVDPLWNVKTLPSGRNIAQVASGGGVIVAVGAGGLIATSNDNGNSWSEQTVLTVPGGICHYEIPSPSYIPIPTEPARTAQDFLGVTYGGGRFVAVGRGNAVVTSVDGNVWTDVAGTCNAVYGTNTQFEDFAWHYDYPILFSFPKIWNAVTYADGIFVAVGEGSSLITSTDGVNWTVRSGIRSLIDTAFRGITYSNGRFVAVGGIGVDLNPCRMSWNQGASIVISDDGGVTWRRTAIDMPGTYLMSPLTDVIYANGEYTAVGMEYSILKSKDGATWNPVQGPRAPLVTKDCSIKPNMLYEIIDKGLTVASLALLYFDPSGSATQAVIAVNRVFTANDIANYYITHYNAIDYNGKPLSALGIISSFEGIASSNDGYYWLSGLKGIPNQIIMTDASKENYSEIPTIQQLHKVINTGSLLISVGDGGTIAIRVAKALPTSPANVTAAASANGTTTVTFSASANYIGPPVTSYTVTSNPSNITSSSSASFNFNGGPECVQCIYGKPLEPYAPGCPLSCTVPASTSINVAGLTTGVTYTFSVVANNSSGTSLPSASSNSVTASTYVAPGPPQNVSASASNGKATVYFSPPATFGGLPVTTYTVTSVPSVGVTATGKQSPITMEGLVNGTTYTFYVTATNNAGTSQPASSNAVTPQAGLAVPFPPIIRSVRRGPTQAQVYFDPPAYDGGSPILSYTVTSDGGLTANGTESPIIVTGNTATVTATNAIGTSQKSATSDPALWPVKQLDAPTNVQVSALGNGVALISFSGGSFTCTGGIPGLPSSCQGQICVRSDPSYSDGKILSACGAGSPITVSGLENGQRYKFSVNTTEMYLYEMSVKDSLSSYAPAITPTRSPLLKVSPSALDFGEVPVGTSGTSSGVQIIMINNNGTGDLSVASIATIGGDNGSFSLQPGSCDSLIPTLPPGKSCSILVRGMPTTEGVKSSSIRITSNDPTSPTKDIPLSANALKVFKVTPIAGTNGTVTPTDAQWVYNGKTVNFTITSNPNYQTVFPVGGTCPQGTFNDKTYTSGVISGDCTVSVSFVPLLPDILGTPDTSIIAGRAYSFNPGSAYTDSFSIRNKPSWAQFNLATGTLTGTAIAGIYPDIVITAINGVGSKSLPAFTITVSAPPTANWTMRQHDMHHTGRADYTVPQNRLNSTFFDTFLWQTPAPGPLGGTTMSYYDGSGSGGKNLIVGGYHWPKGTQGMDRQTGKRFWYGNTSGGESAGEITPAFSPNGQIIYVTNDYTDGNHPLMAFKSDTGPSSYWHNGADANPNHMGSFSPTISPDGRVFLHEFGKRPYAAQDNGNALTEVWSTLNDFNDGYSNPSLYKDGPFLWAFVGGRYGSLKAFTADITPTAESWSKNTDALMDGDPTIDPTNGNIYIGAGENSIYVVGVDKNGNNLWSDTKKQVFAYTPGVNSPQRAQSTGCLSHDGYTYYFQTVAQDGTGALYAVNTSDGSVKWKYNTGSKGWETTASSPIVFINSVIVVGNNDGGTYFALKDDGTHATLLDSIQVDAAGNARASATASPDGRMYLPLRTVWSVGNGDGTAPTNQVANLFTAFDVSREGGARNTLSVNVVGSGNVVPDSGAFVWNGSNGIASYLIGDTVTLTATPTPGSGYAFTGWNGGGCSGIGTCTVTMDSAKSVTATFSNDQELTVNISGSGAGTVTNNTQGSNPACDSFTSGNCVSKFSYNTTLSLLQTPNSLSTFGGWNGCGSIGVNGECNVTMTGPKSVTASFTLAPKAKIGSTGYTSLLAAYSGAGSSATILALDTEFVENLTMNSGKAIILKGGYKADYSGKSGLPSYLKGVLTIGTGSLTVEGVTIH